MVPNSLISLIVRYTFLVFLVVLVGLDIFNSVQLSNAFNYLPNSLRSIWISWLVMSYLVHGIGMIGKFWPWMMLKVIRNKKFHLVCIFHPVGAIMQNLVVLMIFMVGAIVVFILGQFVIGLHSLLVAHVFSMLVVALGAILVFDLNGKSQTWAQRSVQKQSKSRCNQEPSCFVLSMSWLIRVKTKI